MSIKQLPKKVEPRTCRIRFSWKDNLEVKKLLDVISSILADEYIQIAKKNKDVFGIASPPTADRNDESKQGG